MKKAFVRSVLCIFVIAIIGCIVLMAMFDEGIVCDVTSHIQIESAMKMIRLPWYIKLGVYILNSVDPSSGNGWINSQTVFSSLKMQFKNTSKFSNLNYTTKNSNLKLTLITAMAPKQVPWLLFQKIKTSLPMADSYPIPACGIAYPL